MRYYVARGSPRLTGVSVRPPEGHAARNDELARLIASRGESLTAPRIVDRHLSSHDEQAVKNLPAALIEFGLQNLIYAAEEDVNQWSVEGQYSGSYRTWSNKSFVEHFVRLAGTLNSVFDGWGTSLASN